MRGGKALLMALVLVASCAVASAQEGPGAGKVEFGGWPGGGLWLVSGDDNTEVNFNNWGYGGGVSFYLNPMAAIEVESSYGLGLAQGVNYHNAEVFHVQVPNTLGMSGNIVIFPGGSQKQVVGYVTGGVGSLWLISRNSTKQFGITSAETFIAENVGGGVKIFRGGDARNWGFRIDYRLLIVNSKSDAVPFFAQSKSRMGHRIYIGMLYTLSR
jgi:hypothetical protein